MTYGGIRSFVLCGVAGVDVSIHRCYLLELSLSGAARLMFQSNRPMLFVISPGLDTF